MTDNEERSDSGDDEIDYSSVNGKDRSLTYKASLKNIEYYSYNALHQVFDLLDVKKTGSLAKSQLQVICANICNVLNIAFNGEDLKTVQDQKSELTFEEFFIYIKQELITKAADDIKIDPEKFDQISWLIFEKERKLTSKKTLSDEELFNLWRAYNKINVKSSITIDIEEASILVEEFMTAIGTPFTSAPLYNLKNDQLKFWEFVECFETDYIKETPRSVFSEGLDAIQNNYVLEFVKTGCLTKKGHRIKSMKERWFILLPHMISYHENKSKKSKRKGVIRINKNTNVQSLPDTKNYKCRFVITCGERNVPFEVEATTQKLKNEWMTKIQECIDVCSDNTPLMKVLIDRYIERASRREKQKFEEKQKQDQESIIQLQIKELETIRNARDAAQAHAQNESVLLGEERKRRENESILLGNERKWRENETMLLEEERKRREELEKLKMEFEKLLEDEKLAREIENNIRLKQEEILAEETSKRLQLENIKAEQDVILEQERAMREGLEMTSKQQAEALEQERQRLIELDKARQIAEDEMKEAHYKLQAAEEERQKAIAKVEAAKERTRKMRLPIGLAKPLQYEQKGLTTHRGLGSFVDQDFTKTPTYLQDEIRPTAVNSSELPTLEERAQILETNLVKPSQGKATFEAES